MFYIKLDENIDLVITVKETLYRGDNLNRKIVYLLPLTVGDIDVSTAYVYLNYVREDGAADVVMLERLAEKYNESYYQYTFPVTSKLTRCAGDVCTWMQIYTGTPDNPTIQKTGECMLQIEESKNIDDYLCDHQVTAIYKMQKQLEENTGSGSDGDDTEGGSTVTISYVELLSERWVGESSPYSQVVEIDGVTPYSQVDLNPSVEQLTIFHDKDLAFVTENDGGVVTVYAIGDRPANDYVMQVSITEVSE